MKNIIIVICASIFPTLLWANTSSWQCQNTINEVKCKNKNCHSGAVLDSSFKVSIQDHSKVKVCTQNKCWNGHAVSQKKSHQALYPIKQFGWTTQNNPNAEYTLGVNHNTKSLYLQGENQAHPLQCQLV